MNIQTSIYPKPRERYLPFLPSSDEVFSIDTDPQITIRNRKD